MTKKSYSISIFFPFLNDWGTVGSLVCLAISTVQEYTNDWELIMINDGSSKSNREALAMIIGVVSSNKKNNDDMKVDKNRIRIIDHVKNKGYGGALISGFKASTKDLIFYTDCDAQYDPREVGKLIEMMKDDIDMVNGYKIKRNDPWHRVVVGRLYHHFVKYAFGLPIRDTDCDFRLIKRKVFQKVKLFENTGTICVELVKKIDHFGFKIVEVPVHHFWRTSGKSQFFNFERLFKTGKNLLKLWWKLIINKDYLT